MSTWAIMATLSSLFTPLFYVLRRWKPRDKIAANWESTFEYLTVYARDDLRFMLPCKAEIAK